MTTITAPPEPGVAPDLIPDFITAPLAAAVDEVMDADLRIGVQFPTTDHVYVYLCRPPVHVGSVVVVPPNSHSPLPQTADVVTLDPPPYAGPLRRVLAVIG